ncbi:MAG: hypothetical protein M1812_008485, partial [Candelaria pacifica]
MATVHGPARPHQPLTLEKTTSYSFLTEKHGYGPPLEHSSDPGASREQSTSRRLSGSHGKLHKRTSSASSMQHSPGMPSADATIYTGSALTSPPQPYIHEEDASRFPISPVSSTPKIIKPFARRFSSREENSLDLSRSAYETEGHDLYKSEPVSASRSATDITFPAVGRSKGPSHVRSTSGISQLSTGTSGSAQRHYAHPMRQTPRPYTPPLAMSYGNSAPGSEYSGEGPSQGADEELQMRRLAHDTSRLRG